MHQIASVALAVFLLATSILHFAVPARVEELVPQWWPAPRGTVIASGVVEVGVAAGLLIPSTRLLAGLIGAAMFVGYAGVHADDLRLTGSASAAFDKLPFVAVRTMANLAYVAWALYVAFGH